MDIIHILVIEDNLGDARLIEEYLKSDTRVNFVAHFATTLADSMATLADKKFDVVLVDLGLPDSQGIYTFNEIISANPISPIVIVTGNDDEELGIEAVRKGAQNYLIKDQINSNLLICTIKNAIEIKRINRKLIESHERYRNIFEGAASLIINVGPDGNVVNCNNRIQHLLGYSKDEVIGRPVTNLFQPDSLKKAEKFINKVLKNAKVYTGEYQMIRKDGEVIIVDIHASALKDENKKNVKVSCIIDDITDRKLYEKQQLLTTNILSVLNRKNEWSKLAKDILIELKEFLKIEAAGIRYKQGNDYPYFETIGFPDSFIKKENFLCLSNKKGEIIYGSDGKPFLECMCGNIISKRTDTSQSFFTEGGSFWTNSTTQLLASTTDKERLTRTRNYCNAAGYESVALIPLLSEDEIIGLLQLNDKSPNRFSKEMIHFLEKIGSTIGIALKRMESENLIIESEIKYRSLFESAKDGILILDADSGKIIDTNPFLVEMLGYSHEELLGKELWELGLFKNIAVSRDAFKELQDKGYIRFEDMPLESKNAKHIDVEFIGNIYMVDHKKIVQCNIRDITGRKQAEKEVRERMKKLQAFYRMSEIIEREGNTFEKLYQELVNILPDSWQYNEIACAKIVIGDSEFSTRNFKETKWMLKTPIKMNGSPIGNIQVCYLKKMPDEFEGPFIKEERRLINAIAERLGHIVESKKAEEQLIFAKEKAEESDRLKTAFLQNISHEIRTPMNAIVGFCGFISNPELPPEKRKEFTDIIVNSSNQLLSIITDLISIATIEAGQEKINKNRTNINSVCRLIYDQFFSKAHLKDVEFNYNTALSDDEAYITIDEPKLVQIISNLINNAFKFTAKGYISFGYKVKKNDLEFYVKDTGIGIPSELHEKIFNRFYQIEYSASRQYGGSGLGLSISRAYAELLGGYISLTSKPGKGSTFYFTIPFNQVFPSDLRDQQITYGELIKFETPKMIVIAEDEDFNFMLLEEFLAESDISILRAENGMEAVEICKSNKNVDLVLMDIKMPIMNGYEATKKIKEFMPDLPVIAQTAYSTEKERAKAIECGCCDFISKPIEKDLFISKINEYILAEKRD